MDRLEIKARRAAITPGQWVAGWENDWKGTKAVLVCLDGDNVDSTVTGDIDHRDADFIANAPTDIDWLIGEVERLRGLLTRLERESLTCPVCAAVLHLGDRHGLDSDGRPCWLAEESGRLPPQPS